MKSIGTDNKRHPWRDACPACKGYPDQEHTCDINDRILMEDDAVDISDSFMNPYTNEQLGGRR